MQIQNNIVGSIVSHYRIQSVIGRGGMGVLYKAEDMKLKRTVALKFLATELIQDKRSKQRFVREARTASALDHPNICTIHEIDETEDGQLFIAMAFYQGQSLKELMQKGPLSIKQATDIALQIISALAETHEQGIVHRDLKPANIFVTEKGEVKILDFGLAKLATSGNLTRTRTTLGTIAYMAPEQFAGVHVDHRADIWSLGILLFEMMTGKLPFPGDHEQALIYNILNNQPTQLIDRENDVHFSIREILMSALEKSPEKRPASVHGIASKLQEVQDEDILQTTPGLYSRIRQFARKNHRVRSAVISLIVLTLIGILAYVNVNHNAEVVDSRYILVTPFENRSSDSTMTALGDFAADWIRQGLLKTDYLKVADAQSSNPATLGISEAGIGGAEDWYSRISRQTGVGTLVEGSYFAQADSVIIHSRIVDMRHGEILESIEPIRCSMSRLDQGVAILSDKVLTALAVIFDPGFNTWDPLSTDDPPDYEAYKLYSEGMGYYMRNRRDLAAKLFTQASSKDSTFYWAPLRAAISHMMLGMHGIKENRPAHLRTLDSLFVVLNAKRTLLTSYQRNYLDFLIAYREGDHYLGYFATKKMMEESPGSIDAIRECAQEAYRARRPGEGARLLSKLNSEHPLIRGWREYYSIRALFHHLAGEDRKALEVANVALTKTPENDKRHSTNISTKIFALSINGKEKLLKQWFEKIQNDPFYDENGAQWYHIAGRELRAHGKPKAASYYLQKAIVWYENHEEYIVSSIADLDKYPNELYLESLYYAGKLEKLQRICTRLARVDSSHTTVLMYLGLLAAREGNTELARDYSEKIESLKPAPILRHEYAFIWHKRARIAGACGDREEAMRLMRKAVSQGYRYWKFHYEIDFEDMRDYPPFQDFLRPLG